MLSTNTVWLLASGYVRREVGERWSGSTVIPRLFGLATNLGKDSSRRLICYTMA